MKKFTQLFLQLDQTTKTNAKVAAMRDYFSHANAADGAWAVHLLCGNKLPTIVARKLIRSWTAEYCEVPTWLFEECHHTVGDLAETLALVVPSVNNEGNEQGLEEVIRQQLLPLRRLDEGEQKTGFLRLLSSFERDQLFVLMKLITGGFRVGVSRGLVTRALAEAFELPTNVVAHRLMGNRAPDAFNFRRLVDPDAAETAISQPYPFCLAQSLSAAADVETLGAPQEYFAEWKWDGIRAQLIRRQGQTFLWSRGEELMEDQWPELNTASEQIPNGTVLDGEILATTDEGEILPFSSLQRRIRRKTVSRKLLSEVPVAFLVFDILECEGIDVRDRPLFERRQALLSVLDERNRKIRPTEVFDPRSWQELVNIRQGSRDERAEGVMIKRRDSVYGVGRQRDIWWKWKVDPMTVDAVLIYAQKGRGKRANLFTDYTFGVWKDGDLVPFAKAYSGLSDAEIAKVDRFVRQHTEDKFGPVRRVDPQLVMELAFEGIQRSSRHKSGIATRFPRILRWRHDKSAQQANTLDDVLQLLDDGKA
ncbi:MAG TPA: ATP-dependent DNA ligase [Planctomycetaceae bacterium]|nr:ATP-dependent DNA ligase [Planctomycetaceae bacterium]